MYNNAQTDLEIWQSFLEGNEHALEEIYRGQYSRLYAYGIKFVADKELVKDCI